MIQYLFLFIFPPVGPEVVFFVSLREKLEGIILSVLSGPAVNTRMFQEEKNA